MELKKKEKKKKEIIMERKKLFSGVKAGSDEAEWKEK